MSADNKPQTITIPRALLGEIAGVLSQYDDVLTSLDDGKGVSECGDYTTERADLEDITVRVQTILKETKVCQSTT